MCFKKPKPPAPTPADKALEEDLEQQREQRADELAAQLRRRKEDRLADLMAREDGLFGMRSLIQGGKGGAGFVGRNVRASGKKKAKSIQPSPSAPPIMGGSGSLIDAGGGGGGAAGYVRSPVPTIAGSGSRTSAYSGATYSLL